MEGVMSGLKSFLGISTDAISNVLPLTNWKHQRGDEDAVRGWCVGEQAGDGGTPSAARPPQLSGEPPKQQKSQTFFLTLQVGRYWPMARIEYQVCCCG